MARPRSRARRSAWQPVLGVSEGRLGGYCAFLLAATLLVVAATYALLPGRPSDTSRILSLAGTSPGWFRVLYGTLALGGLFGLAIVGPITRLAGEESSAWLAWGRRLAYVGFAVTVLQGVRMLVLLPELGQLWGGCGACSIKLADQQTLARWLYATAPIDPYYLVIFGFVSLWTLAVSVTAIATGSLSRPLAYLGLAVTVGYWLMIFGLASGQTGLFAFASVVTGVFLGPVWYIWFGVLLTARTR